MLLWLYFFNILNFIICVGVVNVSFNLKKRKKCSKMILYVNLRIKNEYRIIDIKERIRYFGICWIKIWKKIRY